MAKKAELLEKASALGLEASEKNTIAQLEEMIDGAENGSGDVSAEAEDGLDTKLKGAAKAGKRSAKSVKEAEEKAEKQERKEKIASGEAEEEGLRKGPKPNTRTKLERRSKKYQEAYKLVDQDKVYSLQEAVELLPKLNTAKFVGSADIHIKLGVDPKQADQNIRGTLSLPNGTGKDVRVAVFVAEDSAKEAKDAGADIVGEEVIVELLNKEVVEFDVLVSTPQLMAKLSKYARLLGPRGLMPNPKLGTVTKDVAKAVKEAKAGKVEYRVDKQGIVHLSVGKLDFSKQALVENIEAILKAIKEAKPSGLKGEYIQNISLAPSMGPSVTLQKD